MVSTSANVGPAATKRGGVRRICATQKKAPLSDSRHEQEILPGMEPDRDLSGRRVRRRRASPGSTRRSRPRRRRTASSPRLGVVGESPRRVRSADRDCAARSAARLRAPRKVGRAIAIRMPMISTTTISSMSVKPRSSSRDGWVRVCIIVRSSRRGRLRPWSPWWCKASGGGSRRPLVACVRRSTYQPAARVARGEGRERATRVLTAEHRAGAGRVVGEAEGVP